MEKSSSSLISKHFLLQCRGLLVAVFLAGPAVLSGCGALTRVDKDTHAREVEDFKLVGLQHDEAVRLLVSAGFECSSHRNREPFIYPTGPGVPVYRRTCEKASHEIFCPQRRYVEFHYTAEDQQVVYIERPHRIEEQSCF